MRRGEGLWLCLGVLVLHAALVTSAAAQPRLKIEARDRIWDLTEEFAEGLRVGKTAEHEFVLKNVGTEPLKIIEATAAEAFLTTVLPEGEIAPGEEGRLKVVMSTEGVEPSLIETHIVVKSNDPASEERPAVLTVKAHITPKLEVLFAVEPQERDIGLVRVGQPKTFTYTYQNAGSEELEIYPLYYKDKRFRTVEDIEREVLEPGPTKTFKLEFTPLPEDAGKRLNVVFSVRIEKTGADAEDLPPVICRVKGYVAPAVEGVQITPRYFDNPENPLYVFTIVNNTARAVEVVATRGEETLGTLVVRPERSSSLAAKVSSEDELKEISLQVNPYFVLPEPAEPEGEAAEGTAAEGTAAESETTEGEGDAPEDPGSETETDEPAGEGA